MAAGRIGFKAVLLVVAGLVPQGAFAECTALQVLVAERAAALHLARKNIKGINRKIAATTDEDIINGLESEQKLAREQHAVIVKKIEASGQRFFEECTDDS